MHAYPYTRANAHRHTHIIMSSIDSSTMYQQHWYNDVTLIGTEFIGFLSPCLRVWMRVRVV